MPQEINGIVINKITKALYDTNVSNGTITEEMQNNQVWIFTDNEHVSASEKTTWNAKSNFSGAYSDLTGKPTKLSEFQNDVGFIVNTVNNLTNYYSKTEVDTKINAITTMSVSKVDTLPTSGISTNTIYLVPKSTSGTSNLYDEYLYINNAWEKIGDTEINLSNYALKSEIPDVSGFALKTELPTVTNDLTDTLKSHYDTAYTHSQSSHAPTNAQANVIETIKVNGVAQSVSSKAVDITVPTAITKVW